MKQNKHMIQTKQITQHFEIPHPLFFARSAEKIFLEVLIISCAGGWQNHGILDLGRRVEQRWPYYFLCRRAAEPWDTGSRPARRAEVAVLFLAQEGGRTMGHCISAGA